MHGCRRQALFPSACWLDILTPHQLGFPISVPSLRALFIIIVNKWMQLLLLRRDKSLTLLAEKNRALVTMGHFWMVCTRAHTHTHNTKKRTNVGNLESRGVEKEKLDCEKRASLIKSCQKPITSSSVPCTLQQIKCPLFPGKQWYAKLSQVTAAKNLIFFFQGARAIMTRTGNDL